MSIKEDGKLGTKWLLWGRHNLPKKLLKKLKKQHDSQRTYRAAVMHTNNKAMALELSELVKQAYPHLDSLDIVDCGAALGAHAGPGAIGIALQEYTAPQTVNTD